MVSVSSLIGTGVALGIVHVLTGPDHLSALATLSANAQCLHAFILGVRWGIGHSTGLLVVGVAFLLLSRSSESETVKIPDTVSNLFETLVGIFMIFLGTYGIYRALEHRADKILHTANDEHGTALEADGIIHISTEESHLYHHGHSHAIVVSAGGSMETDPQTDEDNAISTPETWMVRFRSKLSYRTMALCAGIVHGLAGPGGVLGVIPAVQLHNGRLAAIYLGCFCVASTLTMGVFAVIYGTCSTYLGRCLRNIFIVEIISAVLSVVVGITWLTLLSLGILEDIFP